MNSLLRYSAFGIIIPSFLPISFPKSFQLIKIYTLIPVHIEAYL
jgi:hypothetical protein